ncbi:YbhB/YbcL family Raf kinase inhibitor-like protein [Rhizobium sp. LCM 4573]|uniref:YbhB/YbcL family Raf kinase inhibitor-like protein n=1 Tax=Rhizobium sp. LCM 4573 TaxID=1848291 RepID=UPI0008D9269C|nr:YbhB/YbcL family Raf kinase inhibitor-like protein [Rhizobium sp. LCM 4573]OHV82297.1 phosphatidylethanolamine-binding protein [Rhizobium sp. LCM 4573]
MGLTLISPAFAEDAQIPEKYTRLGRNLMPPLKWSGAPAEVKSFALVIEDPDAPSGTFRHCGVFNIPPNWSELPESADTAPGGGPRFSRNDFGNARYDGPQPPKGHGIHHYHFRLAALDVPKLTVPDAAGIEIMWKEARKHALSEASLTGTFEVQ